MTQAHPSRGLAEAHICPGPASAEEASKEAVGCVPQPVFKATDCAALNTWFIILIAKLRGHTQRYPGERRKHSRRASWLSLTVTKYQRKSA